MRTTGLLTDRSRFRVDAATCGTRWCRVVLGATAASRLAVRMSTAGMSRMANRPTTASATVIVVSRGGAAAAATAITLPVVVVINQAAISVVTRRLVARTACESCDDQQGRQHCTRLDHFPGHQRVSPVSLLFAAWSLVIRMTGPRQIARRTISSLWNTYRTSDWANFIGSANCDGPASQSSPALGISLLRHPRPWRILAQGRFPAEFQGPDRWHAKTQFCGCISG